MFRQASRVVTWVVCVTATAAFHCGGAANDVRAGIDVNHAHLTKRMLTSISAEPPNAIFDVDQQQAKTYRVLAAPGVYRTGTATPEIPFAHPAFPAYWVEGRSAVLAADRNKLYYQRLDRSERFDLPASTTFDVADAPGAGGLLLVTHDDVSRALSAFAISTADLVGGTVPQPSWSIPLSGWVVDLEIVNSGADWSVAVLTCPGGKASGRVEVVNAAGEATHSWTTSCQSRIATLPFNGGSALLLVEADDFVLRSLDGRELRRFASAGVSRFRDPLAAKLPNGQWVFTASGSGYLPWSSVSLFDENGDELYREVIEGRIYTLQPVPDSEAAFILSAGPELWRYDRSSS